MPMKLRSLLLCLALLPLTALAEFDFYQASLEDSTWKAQSQPLACELVHEVPFYGSAVFLRRPNKPVSFFIQSNREEAKPGEALLNAIPPAWKAGEQIRDLGRVKILKGRRPVQIEGDIALRMLYELEQGMEPVFSYLDWSGGKVTVKVGLSPIRFKEGLDAYLACVQELPPFTFDEVRFRTIGFPAGGTQLDHAARVWLDQVAQYLRYDAARNKEVTELHIIGHTDSKGSLAMNEEVARQRAEAVRSYLAQRGVNETLFAVESFGERRPLYSNLDPAGRAKNRRVTVELRKRQ